MAMALPKEEERKRREMKSSLDPKEAARPTASRPAGPWSLGPTSWFSEAQVSRVTEVLNVRIKETQRRFPT